MNHHQHATRAAIQSADHLPPLKQKKDPIVAAICGFCLGGIGLGLYFGSWLDLFLPIALWVFCALFAPVTIGTSVLLAACFCAVFGYRRARASNDKLERQYASPPIIDAEIVCSPARTVNASMLVAPPLLKPPPLPPPLPSAPVPRRPPIGGHARTTAPEDRLQKLVHLLNNNFISQAEYESKRQQILGEI